MSNFCSIKEREATYLRDLVLLLPDVLPCSLCASIRLSSERKPRRAKSNFVWEEELATSCSLHGRDRYPANTAFRCQHPPCMSWEVSFREKNTFGLARIISVFVLDLFIQCYFTQTTISQVNLQILSYCIFWKVLLAASSFSASCSFSWDSHYYRWCWY